MKDRRSNQVDALLSIAKVAERCAVSTSTVRRWIEECGLPISRPGNSRLIRIFESDLAEFIDKDPPN